MRKRRFLWITDPWDTLDHPRDTSLRLAEEAIGRGHECWWCDVRDIRVRSGRCELDARRIEAVNPGRAEKAFRLGERVSTEPGEFTSLQYRVDPPVDLAYLHPLQLLALARGRAELVNPARALFERNEKLEAWTLGPLGPPGLAATSREALEAFGREEGRAVLKPLHEAQSKGVELLDWRTPDGAGAAARALESASAGFTRPVLLQRFLPGIAQGELRLWFLDGKLLAWVRKLPLENDFRVNLDRGSRVAACELDRHDKAVAQRIARRLDRLRIRLAAVDVIDGFVTDFNFTSPGLIVQMENVLGENLAGPIVKALAR
jgi:glutathione synthase